MTSPVPKVPTPDRAPADHAHDYCERGCDEKQAHCWRCPDTMDNAFLDWAEAEHEALHTVRAQRDALLGVVRLAVEHWDGRDVTDEQVETARALIKTVEAHVVAEATEAATPPHGRK